MPRKSNMSNAQIALARGAFTQGITTTHPEKAAMRRLEAIVDKAVPDRDRVAIFKRLARDAKAGDVKSAALVLAYIYGKPVERQEISGPGGAPITLSLETAMNKIYGLPEDAHFET